MSGEAASRLLIWALRGLLLFALWLALADSRALPELIAAAVFAGIGAVFAGLIVRPGNPETLRGFVQLGPLGPRILLRPLWRLAIDTGLLATALWRRARGREVAGSFRAAKHSPEAIARTATARGIAEIWGSLLPNRYVIGIDDENAVILVHELVRADDPLDPLAR